MAARRTRHRWMRALPTATLTVVPFVVVMPKAQAFFPPITGGTTQPSNPPPVVVVPPTPPPPFNPPPTTPPPVMPPPVVIVPPVVPPPPHCVPEPSTLVVGLIGLAAAGIARSRKKKE